MTQGERFSQEEVRTPSHPLTASCTLHPDRPPALLPAPATNPFCATFSPWLFPGRSIRCLQPSLQIYLATWITKTLSTSLRTAKRKTSSCSALGLAPRDRLSLGCMGLGGPFASPPGEHANGIHIKLPFGERKSSRWCERCLGLRGVSARCLCAQWEPPDLSQTPLPPASRPHCTSPSRALGSLCPAVSQPGPAPSPKQPVLHWAVASSHLVPPAQDQR